MSHIVTVETMLKNTASISKACARLKWKCVEKGVGVFYNGNSVSGCVVNPTNWKYPIVIKESGEILSDTYNGNWGKDSDLNRLKQYYALEEAQATLGAQGLFGYETMNEETGAITLEATVY